MKPSRALQIISLSWLFLGFVSVAALTLLIRFMPKMEWRLSTNVPVTNMAQEVPGSALYRGMPVGRDELFAWIHEQGADTAERRLRAYASGRLPVGPRIESPDKLRFLQAVAIPTEWSVYSSPLESPACGTGAELCEVYMVGPWYFDEGSNSSIKLFLGEGLSGFTPLAFTDNDHALFRRSFGDGPCYKETLSVYNVTSTQVVRSATYEATCIDYSDEELKQLPEGSLESTRIKMGDAALMVHAKRNYDEPLLTSSKAHTVFLVSNGKTLLRFPVSEEVLSDGFYDTFENGLQALMKDPKLSTMNVTLNGKSYSFRFGEKSVELVR